MENRPSPLKLIALLVLALAGAGAGFWWLKIHDFSVRVSIDEGVNLLRDAGPLVFFTAMAVLPAVGAPMSFFYLTAGSAFTAQLGLAGVLVGAGLAIVVNLTLTYWLARYGLRPWLERMISRSKYKIPVVAAEEQAEITVLLRITPGPPYFLQSYLLGLAEVRFGTYLWISWVISIVYGTGFIIFGDAILHGKGKVAFLGLSMLVAVALGVHLLRKHYGKKGT
ncbi:MAG: VTT domain-containing protein [bacterium]|nr:VTT domain-containing protein [bacterium]MDI1335430.1 VTT domain-containing protein [Lacunisphaera sp.]